MNVDEKYTMSDIYWAEECVDNTQERAEICNKSNESKDELQFYLVGEVDEEHRRTKRTLWLARATVAQNAAFVCWNRKEGKWEMLYDKWKWVERKCRAKAEEFK